MDAQGFDGIEVFVRVARAGSFSVAARDLDQTPSAISKRIGRLEDRLGARLFNRTTRRVRLTEVGAAFFERCVRIVSEMDEAERAVSQSHAAPRGTLGPFTGFGIGSRRGARPCLCAPVLARTHSGHRNTGHRARRAGRSAGDSAGRHLARPDAGHDL